MTTALRIPDRLRHFVVSAHGDEGQEWLARLPSLVARVSSAWQLDVGAPFEPGGNVGWVAPVRLLDGNPAVLKVAFPGHPNRWEARGLEHFAGRGAARLFDVDPASHALLLERCVPGTNGDDLDAATGNEVVASVLAELHAVGPAADDEFEPLAVLVDAFRETMWDWFERFEHPMDRSVVAQADELFTSLLASSSDIVLLHGDLGPGNVVLSERGWLAIDPHPAVGDRAFDVKQVLSLRDLRNAREQIDFFADRLDLDAQRIAAWTFACCVQVALWYRRAGDAVAFGAHLDRIEQLSSLRLL
jgi:streptomycin 6-kinase